MQCPICKDEKVTMVNGRCPNCNPLKIMVEVKPVEVITPKAETIIVKPLEKKPKKTKK
jgi:hypothetical protein